MPFNNSVDYIQQALNRRYTEILEGKKQLWFTSQVETYAELFDEFERDSVTNDWEKIKAKPTEVVAYKKVKLQMGWLGGQLRDLRTLYVCGTNNHPRSTTDDNRFSLVRIGFVNFILNKLIRILS